MTDRTLFIIGGVARQPIRWTNLPLGTLSRMPKPSAILLLGVVDGFDRVLPGVIAFRLLVIERRPELAPKAVDAVAKRPADPKTLSASREAGVSGWPSVLTDFTDFLPRRLISTTKLPIGVSWVRPYLVHDDDLLAPVPSSLPPGSHVQARMRVRI